MTGTALLYFKLGGVCVGVYVCVCECVCVWVCVSVCVCLSGCCKKFNCRVADDIACSWS